MATVQYDFTDDSVGTDNTANNDTDITGFTFLTNASYPWQAIITSDGDLEESRGCQIYDPSGQGDIITMMHETDTIGDVADSTATEVLVQFRVANVATLTSYWPIVMRDEGADGSSFMCLGGYYSEQAWRIVYYNGTDWWSDSATVTKNDFAVGDIVWARMSVNGSNEWSLTMWEGAYGDEPAKDLDDVTFTNSDTLLGGNTGFGASDYSERPFDWGWFSVGTGGDPAPGPAGAPAHTPQNPFGWPLHGPLAGPLG